jgi:hypothetical protein
MAVASIPRVCAVGHTQAGNICTHDLPVVEFFFFFFAWFFLLLLPPLVLSAAAVGGGGVGVLLYKVK